MAAERADERLVGEAEQATVLGHHQVAVPVGDHAGDRAVEPGSAHRALEGRLEGEHTSVGGHQRVSLGTTTVLFAIALLVTFVVWYGTERTLSIHTVCTPKREAFYWSAILFTFALGTAAGDLLAEGLDLGYWKSASIFGALISLVFISWRSGVNPVLAFWTAYVLTRPLGASLGDYLSQPAKHGGLGFGTVKTSLVFLATIIGVVMYLAKTKKDRAVGTVPA